VFALPFWYQLTLVVPDKGPLNGCVCEREREKDIVEYQNRVADDSSLASICVAAGLLLMM